MNSLLFLLMLAAMAAGFLLSEKRSQQGHSDLHHPQGIDGGVSNGQPTAPKWM